MSVTIRRASSFIKKKLTTPNPRFFVSIYGIDMYCLRSSSSWGASSCCQRPAPDHSHCDEVKGWTYKRAPALPCDACLQGAWRALSSEPVVWYADQYCMKRGLLQGLLRNNSSASSSFRICAIVSNNRLEDPSLSAASRSHPTPSPCQRE